MALNGTVNKSVTAQGVSISSTTTHSGDVGVLLDESISASTTDAEYLIAIDVSRLLLCAIESTVDMTLETNDSSSPQETISLTANKPVIFEDGDTALFSGDVDSIYVTSVDAGTLKLIAVHGD